MANEIIARASLSVAKSGTFQFRDSRDVPFTMTGTYALSTTQTVGTSAEALLLGELTAARAWYWIKNIDSTNIVHLLPASGGTPTTSIGPGEFILGRFTSSITAPFVQALVAPCIIDVLLVQA